MEQQELDARVRALQGEVENLNRKVEQLGAIIEVTGAALAALMTAPSGIAEFERRYRQLAEDQGVYKLIELPAAAPAFLPAKVGVDELIRRAEALLDAESHFPRT